MKKLFLGLSVLILASCVNENSQSSEDSNLEQSQFQWDFSKKRKFIYSFSQTTSAENKMDKDRPASKTYFTGIGHLNIRVKENNLADLSLTDIDMNYVSFNDDGTPRDTMTQKNTPATVVQDMKPDGSFKAENTNILFDMILPLPTRKLNKGESEEIPLQVPFNFNGAYLNSKGHNTLTFVGFENIDGRNCAVFKGVIDISKLDIPEEIEGEYKSSTTGHGTYYFDLKNGVYVGANVEINKVIMMDSESNGEDDLGMYADTRSTDIIKIRLEKIEE